MLITKKIEIDMAHRVCFHKSKCRNLHGHRYVIEVGVDDKVIADSNKTSSSGMVIDFSDLKATMMKFIDEPYDHGCVLYKEDLYVPMMNAMIDLKDQRADKMHFVDFIPTAENLAKHWFEIMDRELGNLKIQIHHVTVWETPSSTATYTLVDAFKDDDKVEGL